MYGTIIISFFMGEKNPSYWEIKLLAQDQI